MREVTFLLLQGEIKKSLCLAIYWSGNNVAFPRIIRYLPSVVLRESLNGGLFQLDAAEAEEGNG